MNDTERLDALEAFIWSKHCGTAFAIWMSWCENDYRAITFIDLGDGDSALDGDDIVSDAKSLRAAIDALPKVEGQS